MTNNTNTPDPPAPDDGGHEALPSLSSVTPDALVQRFCRDNSAIKRAVDAANTMEAARAAAAKAEVGPPIGVRDAEAGFTRYRGFCGLQVIGATDRMVSGFDDGADFMAYLCQRGWRSLASKNYSLYAFWLHSPARDGAPEAICQYVEADLTVWIFDNQNAALRFRHSIPDAS